MIHQTILYESASLSGTADSLSFNAVPLPATAQSVTIQDPSTALSDRPVDELVEILTRASANTGCRDQIVRIVAGNHVGLIGIEDAKFITGATVNVGDEKLSGIDAIRQVLVLEDAVYDLIALKTEILARKLKQSLGISLPDLLSELQTNKDISLREVIEQQICFREAVSKLTLEHGFKVSEALDSLISPAFPEGWEENFPKPPYPDLDEAFYCGPDSADTQVQASNLLDCNQLSWNADSTPQSKTSEVEQEKDFDPSSLDAIPTPTGVVATQNQRMVVIRDLEATLTRARIGEGERADSAGTVSRITTEFQLPKDIRNDSKKSGSDSQQGLSSKFKDTAQIYLGDMNRKSSVDRRKFIDTGRHNTLSFHASRQARKNFAAIAVAIAVVMAFGAGFMLIIGANETLDTAHNKFNAGDLVGAKDLYDKLIVKDPNNFAAYAGRAEAIAMQSPAGAARDFQKSLALKPGATAVREKYADFLLKQNKVAEAMAQAKIVLAGEPDNGNANRVVGICDVKLGSYSSAIEPLRVAVAADSGNRAELSYYLYKATLHTHKKSEAGLYIDEAVKLAPDNARYLIDRARFRISEANFAGASKDLRHAEKLAPLNPEPKYLLGICAYEQSDLNRAISNWTEALNRGFESPDLYQHRGHALFEQGAFAQSLQDLDRYLQFKPEDKTARRRRAIALQEVKRHNPAARILEVPPVLTSRAKAVYPGNDLVDSGYHALQAGDSSSAVSILTRAVQQNPDNPLARKYLAYAHLRAGSMNKALTQLQAWNYLQAIPPSELWVFGKTFMKSSRYAEATHVFDNIVKSSPGDSAAKVQLIKAYSLAGQNDRARSICLEAMSGARDKNEYDSYRVLMP